MKRILLNTAALLFASAACEPAPYGLDAAPSAVPDVAESSRSLTGGLYFLGACNPVPGPAWTDPPARDALVLQGRIRDAKAFAEGVVFTDAFRTCVEQSIPIDAFGWTAERIVRKSTTPENIYVECADLPTNVNGRAFIDIDEERFKLDTEFVRTGDIEDIAGVIVHEILHTHGATHLSGGGISFNVPRVAQRCIANGRTEGTPRGAIAGDVGLGIVGGMGGVGAVDPVYSKGRCNADEVGRGLELKSDGWRITAASLLCADERSGQLSNERPVGGYDHGAAVSGATTHGLRCPNGWAMTGMVGRQSDIDVRQVRVACTPISAVRAGGADTPTLTGLVGASVGYAFERHCPAGKIVMGVRQRGHDAVGGLELVCDDIAAPAAPREQVVVAPGQPASNQRVDWTTCEGEQFAISFFGDRTNSGSLERIGTACRTVQGDDVDGRTLNRAPPIGGASDEAKNMFEYWCGPGEVVVGYRVWFDHRARGAVPRCATPAEWRQSTAPHRPPMGPVVSFPGQMQQGLCGLGRAATGFRVRGSGSVKQLYLRCKDLPVPAAPTTSLTLQWGGLPSTAVGGTGGQPFEHRCPEGGPLSGAPVTLDPMSGALDGVGAWCGATDGVTMSQDGYLRAPVGNSPRNIRNQACADGRALVGVWGQDVGHRIGRLGSMCQTLAEVRSGSAQTVNSPVFGNESGTWFWRRCPVGQVVTALKGRVGARLDQIDVECGPPDLVRGSSVSGLHHDAYRRIVVGQDSTQALSVRASTGFGSSYEVLVQRGRLPSASDYAARATVSFFSATATIPGPTEAGVYWVRVRRIGGTATVALTVL